MSFEGIYAVFFDWVDGGFFDLPWWQLGLIALVLTQITIAAVTIFLHRCQAHRSLDLHPVISHFFRFWLWLTTGMVTREWAAVHRKVRKPEAFAPSCSAALSCTAPKCLIAKRPRSLVMAVQTIGWSGRFIPLTPCSG